MSEIVLNKKLWEISIEDFKKLYSRDPESPKDWSRIAHIYTKHGGSFKNQESIIPKELSSTISKEGVMDSIKRELKTLFSSPITLGIALYFLNKLRKSNKGREL